MGQVPGAKPWLLVGDGRLATHLAFYFDSIGTSCLRWSRRGRPGDPRWPSQLDAAIAASDRVLLAIRDDALGPFVARHRRRDSQPWVHFAGGRLVPGAWTAHPLCTFGPEPYEPGFYRGIPFVVEAGGPSLRELLPGLPNPAVAIPAADKPLYHALCVVAGNLTTLVWQRFFSELRERWGMGRELARPYLERTARNLAEGDPEAALTGPIARGDSGTIARNQAALEAAGLGDLAELHAAFARGFAQRAEQGAP
jgi:hypothetical protein